jgi:hypothetical protein
MSKKILATALITIFLVSIMSFAFIPTVNAVTYPVQWINEDTETKGAWFDAQNSPIGMYGGCAHIFPGQPGDLETPIGHLEIPFGDGTPYALDSTPYEWPWEQKQGYTDWYSPYPTISTTPPYWDEFVFGLPQVIQYEVTGTKLYLGDPVFDDVQFPAFTYAWTDFSTSRPADLRPLYYTQNTVATEPTLPDPNADPLNPVVVGGPGWRAATWDDGGERCYPDNGYIKFTLTFPIQGYYVLSLYAYDYEMVSRSSEKFQIWDSTMTSLWAEKQISEATFDNGVYESFLVNVPNGGLTFVLLVYNDAGHVTYVNPYPEDKTNNVVLQGIFVDNVVLSQACGRTKGFWQQNAEKDLGLSKGKGIQVDLTTYKDVLGTVQHDYGPLINDWLVSGNPSSPLGLKPWAISTSTPATATDMKWAIHWLSYGQVNFNGLGINTGAPSDLQTKARGQMLCLMLTASWNDYGGVMYNGKTVSDWISDAIDAYNVGDFAGAFSIATMLNNDSLCGSYLTPVPTLPPTVPSSPV